MSSYQGRFDGHNPSQGQNQQGPQYQPQPAPRIQINYHPQYPYRSSQQHLYPSAGQHTQPVRMADNYSQKPHLEATFYPGADDFYMPELVSPSPQRHMPEVPSNIQEGLANLELEARSQRISSSSTSSLQSPSFIDQQKALPQRPRGPGFTASYEHTNASAYQNINRDQYGGALRDLESPKFSPFPKLRNPAANVPLSDEDKEEVLERARPQVLKSTDPEMQLAWAQDALSWVEVASQSAERQAAEIQSGRTTTPKVEHQLREDALNIVKFLAEQHHPKADFMKGMWLEFGKFGFRLDKKEAFLAYRRSAEKGYARAEYRMGMQYETSNNPAKAIEHYQKGVKLGDSASNYRLGMMTLLGQHGMPQDYQLGVDLIRIAADTADENAPQGAYIYGMLLSRELPNITIPEQYLPIDMNDAKLFIEKAAYLGFAKAQLKMAQAYELCQLGCEFEPALSLHYNALAARQGESEADMAISKWFLCGYEGVFEKNEELAFIYAKRAAQAKLATAEFAMGYFYEVGIYVPIDLRESEMWYQKAADHGNKDALGRIDSIKKNNTLSKKDHEQVAISRIKSQYGSQRGKRPERFRQKPVPMGSMEEERMEMPEPRSSYAGPGVAPLNPRKPSPGRRPVSAAPYPEDDVVPVAGGSPIGYGFGLRPDSGPQADRPSSAFGIRPLQHSSPETINSQGLKPQEPMRPSTSQGNMPIPHQPTLPLLSTTPTSSSSRLQKPLPSPNMNKPQPSPIGNGADYGRPSPSPNYGAPVQRRDPAANQFIRPERGSSMTPIINAPVNARPERYDSIPSPQNPSRISQRPLQTTMSSQQGGAHSRSGSSTPQQTVSSQQAGAHSRSGSATPSTTPSTSSAPKKTGPATFEEMGIPNTKQDSDCIIM